MTNEAHIIPAEPTDAMIRQTIEHVRLHEMMGDFGATTLWVANAEAAERIAKNFARVERKSATPVPPRPRWKVRHGR